MTAIATANKLMLGTKVSIIRKMYTPFWCSCPVLIYIYCDQLHTKFPTPTAILLYSRRFIKTLTSMCPGTKLSLISHSISTYWHVWDLNGIPLNWIFSALSENCFIIVEILENFFLQYLQHMVFNRTYVVCFYIHYSYSYIFVWNVPVHQISPISN